MTKTKVMTPPTIMWPAEVEVPRDNGTDKLEISVKYVYMKVSEREVAIKEDRDIDGLIHGWEGVRVDEIDLYNPDPKIAGALAERLGEIGSPMPFTPENLELKLESPHYKSALVQGFLNCQTGAKPKN